MKVYVAGHLRERDVVSEYIGYLRANHVEVTYDWTVEELPGDQKLTPEDRVHLAKKDLAGIDEADLLWVILPKSAGGSGHMVELGYALALGKPLVVSGDCSRTIFCDLATRQFPSNDGAFAYICDTHYGTVHLL